MAEQIEPAPTGYATFIWLAWYSATTAVRRHLPLFFGSVVLVTLAEYGAGRLNSALSQVENSFLQGLLQLTAFLALAVVVAFAVAPIAIAVHRLVVLNGDLDGVLSRRVWRFAIWLVGIWLFNEMSSLPPIVFGQSGSVVLVAMIGVAVAAISLRTALVFPSLATDEPAGSVKERVEESWRRTHGHFWRLLLVSIGAGLPIAILGLLLNGVTKRVLAKAAAAIWPVVVADVIDGILVTVLVALGAGVASWVYLWALDHPYQPPAETQHGSPQF